MIELFLVYHKYHTSQKRFAESSRLITAPPIRTYLENQTEPPLTTITGGVTPLLKAVENNEMLIHCLKMFNPACAYLAKIHTGDVSAAVAGVREYLCGAIPGARQ